MQDSSDFRFLIPLSSSSIANNVPHLANVFFPGAHVADRQSRSQPAVQACMRNERLPCRVDAINHGLVRGIAGLQPEAHRTENGWSYDLKPRIALHEFHEQPGEADMLADEGSQSF